MLNYLNPNHADFIFKGAFGDISSILEYLDPNNPKFIFNGAFGKISGIFEFFDPNSPKFIFNGAFGKISGIFDFFNPNSPKFIFNGAFGDIKDIVKWFDPSSDEFFGKKIIDMFSELFKFIFVPSDESINSLVNCVKDKFKFIDTINNTVTVIQDMFSNTSSLPRLEITLPENDWYSGKVTVMDLSWYAPYKAYGDLVISAFIYVFFLWRIFVSLPSIISGVGGGINDVSIASSDIEAYSKFGFGRRSTLDRRQR